MSTLHPISVRRPDSPTTADRIRAVAERLFATQGVDAVSLRQIAAFAEAGNNNSVQYHFGDKKGLIRSIWEHRVPGFDAKRASLLAKLTAQELDDPEKLLRVLLLPIAEDTDESGAHQWASFLMAIDNTSQMMALRSSLDQAPVTAMVYERLLKAHEPKPVFIVRHRLSVAFRNFFRGLVSIDTDHANASENFRSALIEDYLVLANATVNEPAAAGLIEAWGRPTINDG